MQRQDFIALLQRYLEGTCTPAEKQVMDYWYDLLGEEYDEKISQISSEELGEALWVKLRKEIDPPEKLAQVSSQNRGWLSRSFYRMAASLLLIAGFAYLLWVGSGGTRPVAQPLPGNLPPGLHQESNQGSTSRWIALDDGTRILLRPGSSLQYAIPFSRRIRSVYLSGSAFFEVAKNVRRPFIVHSGDLVTRVVGTSFGIEFRNNDLEVSVATGQVIVEKAQSSQDRHSRSALDGVVLSPNQKVTYFSKNRHFVTGLVDTPRRIAPTRGDLANPEDAFQFENVPLGEVLRSLEAAYGVKIVMANPTLETCPVTADLSNQPLYAQMDILCAALRTTFEAKGTSLVLSGGNCD